MIVSKVMLEWSNQPMIGDLLDVLIKARAGNTGTLVHAENEKGFLGVARRCPSCECKSWFSFLAASEDRQDEDVFECLRCLATITRYDVIGKVEWDATKKRWKARRS